MSYFDPPPDFQQAVTRALRAWRKVGSSESAILDGLYLFDRQQQSGKLDARLFTNQILQLGLDRLEEKLPDQAQILMLRFQDDEPREVAADKVGLSASGLDKVQRKALKALAGEIWQLELQALAERAHKLLLSLPQSGAQELFGVEAIVNDLLDLLQADNGPRTIILAGIGGIGKTSLALEIVRQAAFDKRFQLFAFVPLPAASEAVISPDNLFDSYLAKLAQIILPAAAPLPLPDRIQALQQHMEEHPGVIVIDNLETPRNLDYLLQQLSGLFNSSRLIYTSRVEPSALSPGHVQRLAELDTKSSRQLLRVHAAGKNIAGVADLSDEELNEIVTLTGGNPLALKLVAGLLARLSLADVLAGMQSGRDRSVEKMYRHIYRFIWDGLAPAPRRLLLAMPLVGPEGATRQQLAAATGQSETDLLAAIETLFQYALLEVKGTIRERRYVIHRLTHTFLHTDILGWDPTTL